MPFIYLTGLTQAYRSRICLSATFRLRIPPPTGVVRGPLIATVYSLMSSIVLSGSHSPVSSNAFSPVSTSCHIIFFSPLYAFSTAASNTICDACQISGPIPSPSMNGIIGSFGTIRRSFSLSILILLPCNDIIKLLYNFI